MINKIFDFLFRFGIRVLGRVLERYRGIGKKLTILNLFICFFIFGFILLVVDFFMGRLVITMGKSVPYVLFWKEKEEKINLYDYVVVKTPKDDPFAKGRLIVKKVMCNERQVLKIVGLSYYCCDNLNSTFCRHLGEAKLFSKTGKPVTPYNPCIKENREENKEESKEENKNKRGINKKEECFIQIPSGYYFLMMLHKDSYDSRYLGLIERKNIITKVRPIF